MTRVKRLVAWMFFRYLVAVCSDYKAVFNPYLTDINDMLIETKNIDTSWGRRGSTEPSLTSKSFDIGTIS